MSFSKKGDQYLFKNLNNLEGKDYLVGQILLTLSNLIKEYVKFKIKNRTTNEFLQMGGMRFYFREATYSFCTEKRDIREALVFILCIDFNESEKNISEKLTMIREKLEILIAHFLLEYNILIEKKISFWDGNIAVFNDFHNICLNIMSENEK